MRPHVCAGCTEGGGRIFKHTFPDLPSVSHHSNDNPCMTIEETNNKYNIEKLDVRSRWPPKALWFSELNFQIRTLHFSDWKMTVSLQNCLVREGTHKLMLYSSSSVSNVLKADCSSTVHAWEVSGVMKTSVSFSSPTTSWKQSGLLCMRKGQWDSHLKM